MMAIRRFKQFRGYISGFVANIRSGSTLTEDELVQRFQTVDGKPRIFGRPYLPGSHDENLPRSLAEPTSNLPFILDRSSEDAKTISEEMIFSSKEFLRTNLLKHGAVLLRGLALKTADDFDTFSKGLGLRNLPYIGGSGIRDNVVGDVMTASREPPPLTIEPHNEMSYLTNNWATYISFFCETPPGPGCGGETVLVLNKDIESDLDPEVADKFRKLGIRYTRYLPSKTEDCYVSWQEVLRSENKDAAEKLMKARGYDFEWTHDNSVRYWYSTDAFRPHHITGEDVWFNQAQFNCSYFRDNPAWEHLENVPDDELPINTSYGDGSVIESEVEQHLHSVTWQNAIGLQLRKGDVIFLDNMLAQHGRLGFVGERRLLVSLTSDCF